jgi:cysteinyl-tRNA synthetase
MRGANRLADGQKLTKAGAQAVLAAFRDFDRVIGCFEVDNIRESAAIPAEVVALAEARAEARKAKKFAESDRLRDELTKLGYAIKDVPGGAWELKKL